VVGTRGDRSGSESPVVSGYGGESRATNAVQIGTASLSFISIPKGQTMLQARRQSPHTWFIDFPEAMTDEEACEWLAADYPLSTVFNVEVRNADNPDDVREYRVTRQVTYLVEAAV
jgi:hypothetical protein